MSLIYFLQRLKYHIQDETLYYGRTLESTLLLVGSFHSIQFCTEYGNINLIFYSDKISGDSKY